MFYVKIENEEKERNGDDLKYTFHEKCYICEDEAIKDGCKEHRIPTSACETDKSLDNMSNHFWACSYCNSIKKDRFWKLSEDCQQKNNYCGIIDCTKCDPNEYISILVDEGLNQKITIVKKKHAPCVDRTIDLLSEVYCPDQKMKTAKLFALKEHIENHIGPFISNVKKLHFKFLVTPKVPEKEIEKLKKEVINEASPEKCFSAIKYSYLEKIYNDNLNSEFGKIIGDILKDPSFHQTAHECYCNHR